jgi:hypothetical protein
MCVKLKGMASNTPDTQMTQIKARNKAWHTAIKRLIANHPDEWRALYTQEASIRGVTPRF